MARVILKYSGPRNAGFAMTVTGLIVGLPIFCDSGFIVLSGLNRSIASKAGIPMAVMAGSLAAGLYSVHCLIPPHPGAASAAALLEVDFGRLMLTGIAVAVPATIAGWLWVRFAGSREASTDPIASSEPSTEVHLPAPVPAFLPVIVPIALIAMKSGMGAGTTFAGQLINFAGDPVIALSIGILLAFACRKKWKRDEVSRLLQDAVEKAGGILVIIGAGGAFGAVLSAAKIGDHLGNALPLQTMGLLFPFLVTSILKTAQGSSTVAIITASSLVVPLLPLLGLDNESGRILAVLAMGAGSMMISHANDAYFWVIAKFSGLGMTVMLRTYSMASVWMGLVSFAMVYLFSLIK